MNNSHAIAVTKLRTGDFAYKRGDIHAAIANYDGVIQAAEKLGEPNIKSIALIKKSICMSALNQLDKAEVLMRDAISFETKSVLEASEAALLHHEFSILLFRLKRTSEGLQQEQLALELLQKADYQDKELLILILKQLAVYMTIEKQFKLADGFLDDAVSVALSTPEIGKDSLLHGQLLITRALALIDQKQFTEAQEFYDRGVLLIQIHEGQHNPKVAELYRLLAQHLKAAGQVSDADAFLERASEVENFNKHNGRKWF